MRRYGVVWNQHTFQTLYSFDHDGYNVWLIKFDGYATCETVTDATDDRLLVILILNLVVGHRCEYRWVKYRIYLNINRLAFYIASFAEWRDWGEPERGPHWQILGGPGLSDSLTEKEYLRNKIT